METDLLIARLGSDDPDTWDQAVGALVALGYAAVPALVAELTRESYQPRVEATLASIGLPAFDAVRDLLAEAGSEEVRERARRTFTWFGAVAFPRYVETARHPSPHVRAAVAVGVRDSGLSVPVLVALLADPDRGVREEAVVSLSVIGEPALPLLREACRGGPGRARRGAPRAVLEIAGEEGLGERDRAVPDRLVRVKLRDDRAEPFCCTSWLAVRGGDRAGIVELLGLSSPRPATFAMGVSAVLEVDGHGAWVSLPEGLVRPELSRVFLTPEVAGWTLVVGHWCPPGSSPASPTCAARADG